MCGVVGIIGNPDASTEAFLGLTVLQHRGQDAAGILTFDRTPGSIGFQRVKNLGLVETVFTRENMSELKGMLALGHARYATAGRGVLDEVQPFLLNYPHGLGIVHNGNIVNTASLRKDLKEVSRRQLLTRSDTEVILNLFAEGLVKSKNSGFEAICDAASEVFTRGVGSYSIVMAVGDQGMVAFRDPHGIRPLIWGKRNEKRTDTDNEFMRLPTGESHMVSSESAPLDFLGYEVVRNLEPGEVLFIDFQGQVHTRVPVAVNGDVATREHRPCMFEWIYFASPESEIDGAPVYSTRIELGRALAERVKADFSKRKLEADIIVPIPETSRIAAIAMAESLGIPYREVLIKNRYIKRTFILDSQEKRQKAVNLKLSPVRSEIRGKRVLLVDDSIVRGTTAKKIIELVRAAGAKAVYLVSTCPPIVNPCFYGIDFPNSSELVASERDLTGIEKELGADALIYQDIEGLVSAIHKSSNDRIKYRPCLACLDGKYPTDVSESVGLSHQRLKDRASTAT